MLIGLTSELLLNLLSGAVLPLDHVHLPLGSSRLLLSLNHVLHILSSLLFHGPLVQVLLSGGLLLSLSLTCKLSLSVNSSHLAVHHSFVAHSLPLQIGISSLLLIQLLSHQSLLLLLLSHNVSLSLGDDLTCPLSSLIDLFDYLAFFHFEESNSVTEQFEILFSSLTSSLSGAELPMEGLIIVILIRSQVHLIEFSIIKLVLAIHATRRILETLIILVDILSIITVKVLIVHII